MTQNKNQAEAAQIAAINARLNGFSHPALIPNWADEANWLQKKADGKWQLCVPFVAPDLIASLTEWLATQADLPSITLSQNVAAIKTHSGPRLRGVKNVVVVSSAKGGVGKSTTAVNLALGLAHCGAKVGLLDADIYGPSLPIMLNTKQAQPSSQDGKTMEPVMAYGLATNSIGYLVAEDNAMVWRGPMAGKALAQLANETNWGQLDYLVVDMPPGTGDIQLSLAQQVAITGAVVVTTPQDLALADAIKGVVMFDKVQVPVLGVVENMSYHICSQCGHHEAIFGQGGGLKMAQQYDLNMLGQIPLDMQIRQAIDEGKPTVIAAPHSPQGLSYIALAEQTAAALYWSGEVMAEEIAVSLVD